MQEYEVKDKVLKAFLDEGNLHDKSNYNSYLPLVLKMVDSHLNFSIQSEHGAYSVVTSNIRFTAPQNSEGDKLDPLYCAKFSSYTGCVVADVEYVPSGPLLEGRILLKNQQIVVFPVLLTSALCNSSTPGTSAFEYQHKELQIPSYIVKNNQRIIPSEVFSAENQNIVKCATHVQIRSTFFDINRVGRTNSTLNFHFRVSKCNSTEVTFLIPYQTPATHVDVCLVLVALEASVEDVFKLVRVFSLKWGHLHEFLFRKVSWTMNQIESKTSALAEIGKFYHQCRNVAVEADRVAFVSRMLDREFLPNLSNDCATAKVPLLRVSAICKVIALLWDMQVDSELAASKSFEDRHHWKSRRLRTPGAMTIAVLRKGLKLYRARLESKIHAKLKSKQPVVQSTVFLKPVNLEQAIRSGTWDPNINASSSNKNKTQQLITGFKESSVHMQAEKTVEPHMIKVNRPEPLLPHYSGFGRFDCYTTPESERCMSVRFPSIGKLDTPFVNFDIIAKPLHSLLTSLPEKLFSFQPLNPDSVPVIGIVGGVDGFTSDPALLFARLQSARRSHALYQYMSFGYYKEYKEFFILAEPGRPLRPLLIADRVYDLQKLCQENGVTQMTLFNQLLFLGVVEYLDAMEEYSSLVSVSENWSDAANVSHLEVCPELCLSLGTCKAFLNNDNPVRRTYTSNMDKRSLAYKPYPETGTTTSFSLEYGQFPTITDPVSYHMNPQADAMHVFIAVHPTASNQEDAFTFKKEAVDRGLGMTRIFDIRTIYLPDKGFFGIPDVNCRRRARDDAYCHLQRSGLPTIGAQVKPGQAIVGVVGASTDGPVCCSTFAPDNYNSTVASVELSLEQNVVRVVLSKIHVPTTGDKFFFAHGQKGTIGGIVEAVDLPFISSGLCKGVVPDIFINPCSLVGRATPGLNLECMATTSKLLDPNSVSSHLNVFTRKQNVDQLLEATGNTLLRYGFKKNGKVMMINGTTGEAIKTTVFSGVVGVHMLKHIASQKLHTRSGGPLNPFTRQTTVGRRNGGGAKVGEMENWNFACLGMASYIQSVNYKCADTFWSYFCTKCKYPAIGNRGGWRMCKFCNNNSHVVEVQLPYTSVLCMQLSLAVGWGLTLVPSRFSNQQTCRTFTGFSVKACADVALDESSEESDEDSS